jgi:hypothetical protein
MRGRRGFIFLGLFLFVVAAVASRAENEPQPAAVPAAPPAAATKEPAPPPASVTVIAPREAHGVLGREVRSPTDEDMGRIVDVIVDRTGTVRAAVIDFGGFLGVGSRKIAIDWRLVHFRPENQDAPVLLHLDRAEVQAAPEFVPDVEPLRMLGPPPKVPGPPYVGR